MVNSRIDSTQSDNNVGNVGGFNLKQKFAYAMRCITGDKNGFWLGKIDKWKSSESTLGKRGAKLVLSSPKERERVVDTGYNNLVTSNKYGNLNNETRAKLNDAARKLKNGNVFQRRQAYKEFRSIEKQIMTDFENKKPLTEDQARNFAFGLFFFATNSFDKEIAQYKMDNRLEFENGGPGSPCLSIKKDNSSKNVFLEDVKFEVKTDENENKKIIASFKDPFDAESTIEVKVPDHLFKDDLAKLKTQILNAGEGGCYIGKDGAVKPLSTKSNSVEVPQGPDVPTNEGNNVQTLDGDQNTPEVQVAQNITSGGQVNKDIVNQCIKLVYKELNKISDEYNINSKQEDSFRSALRSELMSMQNSGNLNVENFKAAIAEKKEKFLKDNNLVKRPSATSQKTMSDVSSGVTKKRSNKKSDKPNSDGFRENQLDNEFKVDSDASIPTDPDDYEPIWREEENQDEIESLYEWGSIHE